MDVAGPGFINFILSDEVWRNVLAQVIGQGASFGRSDAGRGVRVQVEFVSANPTGPLHVGHGRGAAVGDAVASLLKMAGYQVEREYYINDMGRQMAILGRSFQIRYLQALGRAEELPEDHYRGQYLVDMAQRLVEEVGEAWGNEPKEAFGERAAKEIMEGLRADLETFGVTFDRWASERELYASGVVEETQEDLRRRGLIYDEDGAVWFRATAFGDEKDRVIIRQGGAPTYFASDIAYHRDKYQRGMDRVIDVWGADHHGYIQRMKGAVQALGRRPEDLQVILVQLVTLLREGKPVQMSTRAGEFVTLREVLEEVGRDAARFFFLMRRADSPLDFDLELAKRQTMDNPVFYVQYGHARCCNILARARERFDVGPSEDAEGAALLLVRPEELAILRRLGDFPSVIKDSAEAMEPHRLVTYMDELIKAFHSFYTRTKNQGPIVPKALTLGEEERQLLQARLLWVEAVRQVLHNGLMALGVSAPVRMVPIAEETQEEA